MVRCAVIGGGLMGCKIAGDLALHGHKVRVHDRDLVILNSVCERLREDRDQLVRDGLLSHSVFSGSILCMSKLEECIMEADFIFEAVTDDLEVKIGILEEVSKLASEASIICSNTLRLDLNKLSEHVLNDERFIGIRFLYPVYFIPEVEINLSEHTSQKTTSLVRTLLESMGKTLFFRSGKEPLILSEEQREYRRDLARQEMQRCDGVAARISQVPELSSSLTEYQWVGLNEQRSQNSISNVYNAGSGSECAICLDSPRDCLLEPCRHLILCHKCASLLLSRSDYCPMCRAQIHSIGGVYLS